MAMGRADQNRWKETKWGELATLEYGKSLRDYDDERSDTKPVQVYGTNGPIGWHSSPLCKMEGIVVGRKGAYRGIHFSKRPFFVIDTAFYVKPKIYFDIQWAFYQLKNFDINKLDSGSAIPSTSRDAFYEIPVSLPPLPEQRRIAGILSAYDGLVENNQRRINILEEMARARYRDWFVRFRFPGHEKVARVTSPLGQIPDGWIRSFSEVVFFQEGPGLRKWQWTDSGMKVINVTNILEDGTLDVNNTSRHISMDEFRTKYRHFAVDANDIVIASSGNTYGKIAKVRKHNLPLMMNTSVIRFAPQNKQTLAPIFLEYFLKSDLFRQQIESFVIGAAQPNFGPTHLKQMAILYPPSKLQQEFDAFSTDLDKQIQILVQQSQNLRQTRDLLLPRLLSGQQILPTEPPVNS